MNRRFFNVLMLAFVLTAASVFGQQVPKLMNFQGILKDAGTGTPVSDGTYAITFSIYDAETGGTDLWNETQSVQVTEGAFSATLGSVTTLDLAFDKPYWLGIKVGSDSEMPRTPLTSSPYSFDAQSFNLPYSGSIATQPRGLIPAFPAFNIVQTGLGMAGRFEISNAASTNIAVEASTNGKGPAGVFVIKNTGSTSTALVGRTEGPGDAVFGLTRGTGRAAVFEIENSSNATSVLDAKTNGRGPAITATNSNGRGIPGATIRAENQSTGSGIAGWFEVRGGDATVVLKNSGTGALLKGFGGNGGNDEFRFENDGTLILYDETNNLSIRLSATTGKTTTKVLEITGGSDLSENFDLTESATNSPDTPQPGMLVSIDPENPGKLAMTREAYDRKVAGIISGAGGINTGMLMGQQGTHADGSTPVALAGRVYCRVDAGYGSVEPGDLLTGSETPGHAMKVTDHTRAQGAIIGKAMTGLEKGRGLVLVLVSLQ